jgi:cysteine synthase A
MGSLDLIGNTPLVPFEGYWVKLECSNPGGSVKDRIARFMLEAARRRGELRPGDTIVEATSGNTGIALAMVARELGHPVLIFMPEHMSVERRSMMEALGARVCLTPREGGFELPIERRDALRGEPGYWVPDQFENPDNTRCHRETTGREILEGLRELCVERVDAFTAGVGTGGTLMGIGAALRERFPEVQVVAVEPEESSVMSGGAPGEHGIFGIGDGFVPALVDMTRVDAVERVSTAAAHAAAERIHAAHGYCVGRSAGANTVAAERWRDRGLTVVTLWPDCADRYASVGLTSPGDGPARHPAAPPCPMHVACAERARCLLP